MNAQARFRAIEKITVLHELEKEQLGRHHLNVNQTTRKSTDLCRFKGVELPITLTGVNMVLELHGSYVSFIRRSGEKRVVSWSEIEFVRIQFPISQYFLSHMGYVKIFLRGESKKDQAGYFRLCSDDHACVFGGFGLFRDGDEYLLGYDLLASIMGSSVEAGAETRTEIERYFNESLLEFAKRKRRWVLALVGILLINLGLLSFLFIVS